MKKILSQNIGELCRVGGNTTGLVVLFFARVAMATLHAVGFRRTPKLHQ